MNVLIVIDNLYTGGIATSFCNFVKQLLKYANCDVLIFNGDLPKSLVTSKNLNIIPTNKRLMLLGCSQTELRKINIFLSWIRALFVIIARCTSGFFSRKILLFDYKLKSHYDVAISFTHDDKWKSFSRGCNQFVLQCVFAREKTTFVHCDFSKFEGKDKRYEQIYKNFNHIACVSDSCCSSFSNYFPNLEKKCITIENFTDLDRIKKLSSHCYHYNNEVVNIVSVCRISVEKGLFRTANVIERLVNEGFLGFHWTIVGGGVLFAEFKKVLVSKHIESFVTLVGEQSNPFYYLADADMFLLPSFHEAAPMVFGECNALGIPIVTTETVSAKELVEDRRVGIVCNNSENGIYDVLKKIILQKGKFYGYSKPLDVNRYADLSLLNYIQLIKRMI